MIETVLIGGNEYPATAALVQTSLDAGKNVMVSVSEVEGSNKTPGNGARSFVWHKPSPISARSMVLETQNTLQSIDAAIVVFDTEVFAKKYTLLSIEHVAQAIDDMILSVQYLTLEIMHNIEKNSSGILCFMLNPQQTAIDVLKNSRSNSETSYLNAMVSAGQAAYRSFAETVAIECGKKGITVLLVEQGIESREEFSEWLLPYIDGIDNLKKLSQKKDRGRWIHFGSKVPVAKSFFWR